LKCFRFSKRTGGKKDHRQQSDNKTLAHRAPGHRKRGIGRDEVGQQVVSPSCSPRPAAMPQVGPEDAQQQDDPR
jgi:hypothetical protein